MRDHRPDLYDRIEIEGPDDVPLPTWLTADWMPCMDCRANLFIKWRPLLNSGRWMSTIAHDDGCPTFAAHLRESTT